MEYSAQNLSELCNENFDNVFGYTTNVSVRSNEMTNILVNIAAEATDISDERIFNVTFNIMDNDCINPMISMYVYIIYL